MKKVLITAIMCCLGISIFAQQNLPFVSHQVIQAQPVQVTPPSLSTGSLYDPLGLGGLPAKTSSSKQKVQYWYTADAILITDEDGEGNWEETSIKILQENLDFTVFAKETHKLTSVNGKYRKEVDEEGNTSLIWDCLDAKGRKCRLSLEHFDNSLFLAIRMSTYDVIYHLIPD